MPEAPGTAVNCDHNLSRPTDAQHLCRLLIVDVIDVLHLAEVIARTQATELLHTTLYGIRHDGIGIRTGKASLLFGNLQVFLKAIAILYGPCSTTCHHLAHLAHRKLAHARATNT